MSKIIKKEYTNGELTVIWQPNKCIHSANCAKNLATVFQPKKRPWIVMAGDTTENIKKTIDTCPSGALSYRLNKAETNLSISKDTTNMDNQNKTDIKMLGNGPLMITGNCKITDPSGKEIEVKEKFFLCRCGASTNKPFCDGKHKKAGFTD